MCEVAARRRTYKKLDKRSALYKAKRKIKKAKAQVRAKVEHPFRVITRQFGYVKTRCRALVNGAVGDAVRSVEPLDGSPTFTDCRRSASLNGKWPLRDDRVGQRAGVLIDLIKSPPLKTARAEVDQKYMAILDHP